MFKGGKTLYDVQGKDIRVREEFGVRQPKNMVNQGCHFNNNNLIISKTLFCENGSML